MGYCCQAFRELASQGLNEGAEQTSSGWAVNGCCHGGGSVIAEMRFCPFCGAPLPAGPQEEQR